MNNHDLNKLPEEDEGENILANGDNGQQGLHFQIDLNESPPEEEIPPADSVSFNESGQFWLWIFFLMMLHYIRKNGGKNQKFESF
ncbi:hypothetical protein DCAR_0313345 [Daucus carota subsp. sativus]|uniref:Uncharacterized protein n=1 Tax=Daucus carota subsp. sativus TaxID=79200 RepID=A0A166BYU7_DAUCS|nr:hypothetical protein DCAR_0313345 [Daucus carota subsp. sativus]